MSGQIKAGLRWSQLYTQWLDLYWICNDKANTLSKWINTAPVRFSCMQFNPRWQKHARNIQCGLLVWRMRVLKMQFAWLRNFDAIWLWILRHFARYICIICSPSVGKPICIVCPLSFSHFLHSSQFDFKRKNKRIQSIFCASASDIIRAVTSVLSHTKMGGRVVRSVALFFQTMQIRNIKQDKKQIQNKNK